MDIFTHFCDFYKPSLTDIDPRNGIPKLTPGDNLYMYPEQSKDFHKVGSTLPPVNFSL